MKLSIPDMTCAHCKSVVERTVIDLDSEADVVINLENHTARITTSALPEAVITALKSQGYAATQVD